MEQLYAIGDYGNSMGHQIGGPVITLDNLGQRNVTRTWEDIPAAEAWIEYVGPYYPVSASIIT
jgi:hypothetical protein